MCIVRVEPGVLQLYEPLSFEKVSGKVRFLYASSVVVYIRIEKSM
jgi:hypothetical protein